MVMKRSIFIMVCLITLTLTACNNEADDARDNTPDKEAIEVSSQIDDVIVTLRDHDGIAVATATLTETTDSGVQIRLEGDQLPPGEHGFHIHDRGACVAPDFESAGSHYNPTESKHGFDHPDGPHAGDLENIIVEEDATVYAELNAPLVTLDPDKENTLYTKEGTSLIIHEYPDDYISQPTGNAGGRISCGIIGE